LVGDIQREAKVRIPKIRNVEPVLSKPYAQWLAAWCILFLLEWHRSYATLLTTILPHPSPFSCGRQRLIICIGTRCQAGVRSYHLYTFRRWPCVCPHDPPIAIHLETIISIRNSMRHIFILHLS
jgi:hypothetical protein